MFNPKNDFFERLRLAVMPRIARIFNVYNEVCNADLYATHPTWNNQFVGRVDMGEEELEKELAKLNFERNPLAALKHIKGTDETEEGSFRWLGTNHDDYRDDFQLHVIIYDGSPENDAQTGETYVFAHWEYRWDVRPVKHYNGAEYAPEQGVKMVRDMFDAHGINYDDTSLKTNYA